MQKKDTITFSARLFFDEEGYILKKSSKIFSSVDSTYKDIQYLLNKFPKTKPTLDEYNRGVATSVTSFHGFKIDSTKTELEPIKDFEPNEVPFEFLEKLPVFNGCDENLNNINLIKCMNNKLMQYIQKNFRGDLIADTVGLPAGVQSIFLFFKIDKEGKIQLDYVRAPHTILEREGERLIEGIPDAKSPGMLNDKAVTVPYFLPISFVVENSNTSNKDRKKRKKKRKS